MPRRGFKWKIINIQHNIFVFGSEDIVKVIFVLSVLFPPFIKFSPSSISCDHLQHWSTSLYSRTNVMTLKDPNYSVDDVVPFCSLKYCYSKVHLFQRQFSWISGWHIMHIYFIASKRHSICGIEHRSLSKTFYKT